MPTDTFSLVPCPFIVDDQIDVTSPIGGWLQTVQTMIQLKEVDTSGGSYAENVPPAGLNATTGYSAQGTVINYVKTSADGNTFTLNGVLNGAQTLTAQFDRFSIQSDGTNWLLIS